MKNATMSFLALMCFWPEGCVEREPKNTQADILEIRLPDPILINPPSISNATVRAFVKYEKIKIGTVTSEFVLTPGATTAPQSDVLVNFRKAWCRLMKIDIQTVDFKTYDLFGEPGLIHHFIETSMLYHLRPIIATSSINL